DPSKPENSEYTKDLPPVPGIPEYYKSLDTSDISALNGRINEDKQKITDLTGILGQLQAKREEANKIASQWRIWNTFNSEALGTGPNSINYNRWRVQIIDQMIADANQKIALLNNDMAARTSQIAKVDLSSAMASNDQDKITAAQTRVDQSIKSLQDSRVVVQTELAKDKALNDASCWPAWSLSPNIGNCILIGTGWVSNIIVSVFALLLWLASTIFDASVAMSISAIGAWFSAPAVANVWKVARDLANLCFVFVLLYIALGTVFELEGMGSPQKMIVNVVVIALLVNFSGFFTRVVIDASNVIAYEFYSQMNDGGKSTISTKLVKNMNLGAYFISASTQTEANSKANKHLVPPVVSRLNFISIIGQTLGNIIIILVTTFVLLTAAILFIIRTISLLLLYIFSPIAFVSRIIPNNKFNYFQQWLDKLINQAFFAPAFLIPLYVVFKLLETGDGNGIVELAGGSGGGLVMIDAVIIGLLLGCIFIANKFGAAGAKMATGVAGGATLLGAKGISGGFKLAGRYTGGAVGNAGRSASQWAQGVQNQRQLHVATGGNAWSPNMVSRAVARTVSGAQTAVSKTQAVGGRVSATAQQAWESDTGKAFRKSEAGKRVIDAVKNPLLATSDAITDIQAAMSSGGGGSYSFLGKTGKERVDAKKAEREKEKEEKEDKEKKEKEDIKNNGEKLGTAADSGNWGEVDTVLGTMSNPDIVKLDAEILVKIATKLTKRNLDDLQKGKGTKLDKSQEIAIKNAIVADTTSPGYNYMHAGAGVDMWG
ncbi:MAG: hypothetical protein ABII72_03875, partial [Parcubacteria group bacterium]